MENWFHKWEGFFNRVEIRRIWGEVIWTVHLWLAFPQCKKELGEDQHWRAIVHVTWYIPLSPPGLIIALVFQIYLDWVGWLHRYHSAAWGFSPPHTETYWEGTRPHRFGSLSYSAGIWPFLKDLVSRIVTGRHAWGWAGTWEEQKCHVTIQWHCEYQWCINSVGAIPATGRK